MAHAGSESSRDRWFGFIRNIVFATNVTAIAHFASLQYWVIHRYGAPFDLYARGETGAAWSAFQLLVIAALALGNWIVAEREGSRLSLFWLVAAGGFLCLGANEWLRSHSFYERWFAYSALPGSPFLSRHLGGLLMAALTVGAIFLGRAFSPALERRPRVAFYWGWGVGLFVLVGLAGLLPARGAAGDVARITAGLSLLCEAFLVLGFFSEWFARWNARAQPARAGDLALGGSRA